MTLPSNSLTTLPDAPSLVGSLRPSIRFLTHTLQELIQSSTSTTDLLQAFTDLADSFSFIESVLNTQVYFTTETFTCFKNPSGSGVVNTITIDPAAPAFADPGVVFSYTIPEKPLFGTTAWLNGEIVYTPNNFFAGFDSLVISAEVVGSNPLISYKVRIFIRVTNSIPVASTLTFHINEYSPPTPAPDELIQLSASDADNDTLSYKITSLPSSGTLRTQSGSLIGAVPFTLPSNQNHVRWQGPATVGSGFTTGFTYQATDGVENSNEATVSIIAEPNEAPVASSFAVTVLPDVFKVIDLADNTTDADGDTLTYTIQSIAGLTGQLFDGNTLINVTPKVLSGSTVRYLLPAVYNSTTDTTPSNAGTTLQDGSKGSLTWSARDLADSSSTVTCNITSSDGSPSAPTMVFTVSANASRVIELPLNSITAPGFQVLQRIDQVEAYVTGYNLRQVINGNQKGAQIGEIINNPFGSPVSVPGTLLPVRSNAASGASAGGTPLASTKIFLEFTGINLPGGATVIQPNQSIPVQSTPYRAVTPSGLTALGSIQIVINTQPPVAQNRTFTITRPSSGSPSLRTTINLPANDFVQGTNLRYAILTVGTGTGALVADTLPATGLFEIIGKVFNINTDSGPDVVLVRNKNSVAFASSSAISVIPSTSPVKGIALDNRTLTIVVDSTTPTGTFSFKFVAVDESRFKSNEGTITLNIQ